MSALLASVPSDLLTFPTGRAGAEQSRRASAWLRSLNEFGATAKPEVFAALADHLGMERIAEAEYR
jgi:hypothetical protein